MKPTTYVTENKEENYLEIYIFPSIMSIVFTSFKHHKLPISIRIPVTLPQIVYICMTAPVHELPLFKPASCAVVNCNKLYPGWPLHLS